MMTSALALTGCADTRLSKEFLGTANDRFGVQKDIVIVKGNGASAKRRNKFERNASAGSIGTLLGDYESASESARIASDKKSSSAPEALARYRAAGFNLSRGVCSYAFNQLGESRADYKYAMKGVGAAATGGASVLGILSASGEATSIYALGVSLLQSWSDNFEEYAFLAQSVGTLEDKVQEAQNVYSEGVSKTAPTTWGEATIQIQRYNDFCLATGMRKLVEDAVGKARLEFTDHGDVEVVNARTDTILKAIQADRTRATYETDLALIARRYSEASDELNSGLKELSEANNALRQLPKKYQDRSLADLEMDLTAARAARDSAADDGSRQPFIDEMAILNSAISAKRTIDRRGADWLTSINARKTQAEEDRKATEAKLAGVGQPKPDQTAPKPNKS